MTINVEKICLRCKKPFTVYSKQQLQKKYCGVGICGDSVRWKKHIAKQKNNLINFWLHVKNYMATCQNGVKKKFRDVEKLPKRAKNINLL